MTIHENFKKITEAVNLTAATCGRNPGEIKIVSVSKTFPFSDIQEAIDCGINLFGENRVQEAKLKIPELTGNFDFHLIGHLQSNKAKDAVKLFSLIHSIDKLSTAEKVNSEAEKIGKTQKILLQIKTTDEETKSGAAEDDLLYLAEKILAMDNLDLRGVMTVGPLTDDKNIIRNSFRQTRTALDMINNKFNLSLDEISMGMSGDFTIAIEEGSTMIRVGSAIFGGREYK